MISIRSYTPSGLKPPNLNVKREQNPRYASHNGLNTAFTTGIDAVCHIAGHVSLIGSFTDPVHDLRTNVQGTVNVLQLCLRYRVPRLLYASSMTAYGRNGVLPTPEATPCEPISYY
jgi:UDP-glucose 4-epimerase